MRGAAPLAAVLLLVLVSATALAADHQTEAGEEDPEVTACKQQCALQRQFSAGERRYCAAACDEYGRMKKRAQEEGPEKERDRCLHECRARPHKPGCERRCVREYERATGGRSGTRGHEEGAVAGRRAVSWLVAEQRRGLAV
jgi:hypothetical protein